MFFKKSAGKIEDNVHLDRYLITYADLITLLLGLFVILYVSSQVDEEKYKELSRAFSSYFSDTEDKQHLSGGTGGVFNGVKNGIPEPIMPFPSPKSLKEIQTETETAFKEYIDKGLINVKRTDGGLVLTLPEQLLFKSGKAEIEPQGLTILDTLASILHGIDKQVSIDGHTDSDPIKTFRYESNWHLSVARSVNVGFKLVNKGMPDESLVIRGFGSQRPVSDNSTPEGKAKNRRVEINISELPKNAPSTVGYEKNEEKKINENTRNNK